MSELGKGLNYASNHTEKPESSKVHGKSVQKTSRRTLGFRLSEFQNLLSNAVLDVMVQLREIAKSKEKFEVDEEGCKNDRYIGGE